MPDEDAFHSTRLETTAFTAPGIALEHRQSDRSQVSAIVAQRLFNSTAELIRT